MPYKVFVAGEEALAADANSFLMSQTVPRFTNAAQRTSQLAAPVLNQLSVLDSAPGVVWYWTGSAWASSKATPSVPFLFYPNVTLPPAASTHYPFQVTMPVTGSFIVKAIAAVNVLSGTTVQQVGVSFVTASGGNPPTSSSTGYAAGTPFTICSIPIIGVYPTQAAGPVNLGLNLSVVAGGVTLQLMELSGVLTVQAA